MSLSTCLKCGGFIPLGPNASNCCVLCGEFLLGLSEKQGAFSDKDARIAWTLVDEILFLKSGIRSLPSDLAKERKVRGMLVEALELYCDYEGATEVATEALAAAAELEGK